MIVRIGEAAGRIWHVLEQEGSKVVTDLPASVDEDCVVVYQALGWLAREEKVEYGERDGTVIVSLSGR